MKLNNILQLKNQLKEIIANIERTVYEFKKQIYSQGITNTISMLDQLMSAMALLESNAQEINAVSPIFNSQEILCIMQRLTSAQENEDYVQLSDIFEYDLKSYLLKIEELLINTLGVYIEEDIIRENIRLANSHSPKLVAQLFSQQIITESLTQESYSDAVFQELESVVNEAFANGIIVEPTPSGYYTVAIQTSTKHYIHSQRDLITNAIILAEEWRNQNKEEYICYGFGFGYPYIELLESDFNIELTVIESNKYLLQTAFIFSSLSKLFRKNNFSLIYDPEEMYFEHNVLQISKTKGTYILYPAIISINNSKIKNKLLQYFVEEGSIRSQQRFLHGNFQRNIKLPCKSIHELNEKLFRKNIIIVAGGPSLDHNIHELKNNRKRYIIIAVGTVLKKLIHLNIIPDFTIIIDANLLVYEQVSGIENCRVPLIFLSTALHPLVKNYKAEKYILCQKGFLEAEEYAQKHHIPLIESGGSVATTALDLCLKAKAKRIIFVGLDLAYTDNLTHASDTPLQNTVSNDMSITVPAVNGGELFTGKNLKIYLDWIENRIANRTESEKKIQIFDATEGGAIKHGMIIESLTSILETL